MVKCDDKTEFRTEFNGYWNLKIDESFFIRTTSGDDVIATDKTSKTSTAVWWPDIEKREYDSLNSFLQAFQKSIFRLPVEKFFISGLTKTPVTSGKLRICRQIFDMFLRMFQTICRQILSDFEPG